MIFGDAHLGGPDEIQCATPLPQQLVAVDFRWPNLHAIDRPALVAVDGFDEIYTEAVNVELLGEIGGTAGEHLTDVLFP
jgi:hypothetical protein